MLRKSQKISGIIFLAIFFGLTLNLTAQKTTVSYAPTTLFYLRPGGESKTAFIEIVAKKPVAIIEYQKEEISYNPVLKNGTTEGEKREPVQLDDGTLRPRSGFKAIWEEDTQLWWRGANVGDELLFQFISDKAYSNKDIKFQLTQARDYGIVDITLNGGAAITFDGYAIQVSVRNVFMKDTNIKKDNNTPKIIAKRQE